MNIMNYRTINLHDYIDAIEKEVVQGGETFQAKLRIRNKKSIIRILLGIDSNEEFDRLQRSQKSTGEYEKMKAFCQEVLQPRIHTLPPEESSKVPNFDKALESALQFPAKKGVLAFHKLASGREYKGQVMDMVLDLVPELEQQCIHAMLPFTDDEVFLHTIDYIASQESFNGLSQQRVEAAKKCVEMFKLVDNSALSNDASILLGKENGKGCEQALHSWLQTEKKDGEMVLSNCMIQQFPRKPGASRHNVMWTSSTRDRACSELDALILSSHLNADEEGIQEKEKANTVTISEIWEAKFSISPLSLKDVLTKKVSAIRTLMQDDKLSISYNGRHSILETQDSLTVGIFGLELLSPVDAFGQLRSIATSSALSSDVNVALQVLNKGYVELGNDTVLIMLKELREKYIDCQKYFDIVVKIANSFE